MKHLFNLKVKYYGQNNLFIVKSILSIGVVVGVTAFQLGGPCSIPGGVRNFKFYPGTGCVSFVFCPVLSPPVALTF